MLVHFFRLALSKRPKRVAISQLLVRMRKEEFFNLLSSHGNEDSMVIFWLVSPCRWRHFISPKRWYLRSSPYEVITQKTNFLNARWQSHETQTELPCLTPTKTDCTRETEVKRERKLPFCDSTKRGHNSERVNCNKQFPVTSMPCINIIEMF
jgi:hypothetical protein